MTLHDADLYQRNLAALSARQPEVASLVEHAAIPAGTTSAIGRDGTQTFRIPTGNGRSGWFGRSSMPRVSAEAMFGAVVHQTGNVALPGILTGADVVTLINRLPRHCALFVLEDDPASIKLAMHLHDFTGAVHSRRLVFMPGDRLVETIGVIFEREPGYEIPCHLFRAPQFTPAEIAERQRKLESGAETVTRIQSRQIESHSRSIRQNESKASTEAPRVAVVSLDATPIAVATARRIGRALDGLHWKHVVCVPDTPIHCHTAARIRAIDRANADLVLMINHGAESLREYLPNELPIVSWFDGGASLPAGTGDQLGPRDRILATSRTMRDLLIATGVKEDRVEHLSPGADHAVIDQDRPIEPIAQGAKRVVRVVMNLPSDRAEACNVTLASQVTLWRSLQEQVARDVDQYTDEAADAFLASAQRTSGTALRDADVRALFVSLIRTCIAPAAIGRAAVRALTGANLDVQVWGTGWSAEDLGDAEGCGEVPNGQALREIFNPLAVVVSPLSWPNSTQVVLDALAAGAGVVVREGGRAWGDEHPGLAGIERCFSRYRASGDLIAAVRGRLSDAIENRRAAVQTVTAEHSLSQRLRSIARNSER